MTHPTPQASRVPALRAVTGARFTHTTPAGVRVEVENLGLGAPSSCWTYTARTGGNSTTGSAFDLSLALGGGLDAADHLTPTPLPERIAR